MSDESQTPAKVYGRPGCVQCKFTTKEMDKQGVAYNYYDISQNEVAHQEVKALGLSQLPVVVAPGQPAWTGFSPDKIRRLKG